VTSNDAHKLAANIVIRTELKPGDIGSLIYMHGVLYAKEHGWDHTFEAYVAGPLAEFAKSQPARGRIWIVEESENVAGSIAIVEVSKEEAQLRWLLLHPKLRGQGIGRMLMETAISFCKEQDYATVFLWTVSALTAAAKLYEEFGFHISEETIREIWGTAVTEQRYELRL
jgi:GNAT superfamily N-acetyltransferase